MFKYHAQVEVFLDSVNSRKCCKFLPYTKSSKVPLLTLGSSYMLGSKVHQVDLYIREVYREDDMCSDMCRFFPLFFLHMGGGVVLV